MAAILDQLDLVSQNMEATIAFYRLLGAKIPKSAIWATESGAHHVTIPFKGGFNLAFDSPALARVYNKGYRAIKSKRANLDKGQVVIGFSVRTRRSVDETYAKLTEPATRDCRHRGTRFGVRATLLSPTPTATTLEL